MKQTAIDWLVEQVNSDCLNSTFIRPELIQQAKEMEIENLKYAYNEGVKDCDSAYKKVIDNVVKND